MNKLYILVAGIALLVATQPLLAQHSGHSMGGISSGSSGNPDSSMKDMQKMMAVQATEEQSAQLQSWIQSTSALSKQLDDLRQKVVASNRPGESSSALEALKAALNANTSAHEEFVNNLSTLQRSGLKNPVKKLNKTNLALVKVSVEISKMANHVSNAKQFGDTLQKTKKVVEAIQREQRQLVNEMGAKV